MCNLWQNFVDMSMENILCIWFWLYENLFVHGHELVRNFYGDHGHVGICVRGYGNVW